MGLWNQRFPKKDPVWCCKEVPNSRNPPHAPDQPRSSSACISRKLFSSTLWVKWKKRSFSLVTSNLARHHPATSATVGVLRSWGIPNHWTMVVSTKSWSDWDDWGYLHDLGNLRNKQNRSRKGSGWGRLAKSPSSSAGGARIIWPSGNLT